ncbi:MAG: SOS response-associated peptidase [Bacteroidia bacterium]|nr:SOS response-associated peptidase [Bacteroidia bacterium]
MCGRYTFTRTTDAGAVVYPEGISINANPRYNIAPTQYAPVIPMDDPLHTYYFRWGLIPHWAKDVSIGIKMINARAETLGEKPAFREPLRRSRCLVPADGFYEWKKTASGKQPYRITLQPESVFSFAGISDEWVSPEGNRIFSFSIITTEPNELMADIHDRMPVILSGEAEKKWLDPRTDVSEVITLLKPYNPFRMKAYPVSPQVGNVRADHAGLIQPYAPPALLF